MSRSRKAAAAIRKATFTMTLVWVSGMRAVLAGRQGPG
jgi:hypothetical protein